MLSAQGSRLDNAETEFIGFAEFRLDEVQGGTRLSYSVLYEGQMPHLSKGVREAYLKQQYEKIDAQFAIFVPRLKRMLTD
jgi:hypothetical protein